MRIQDLDHSEETKSILSAFAASPRGFLILVGNNGTGKTFCAETAFKCSSVRNENPGQIDDKLFFTQSDLNMKYSADVRQWGYPDYLYTRLSTAKLLLLDDLGTRTPSEAFKDFLYAIIEKRERNKNLIGTIITTNLNREAMRVAFGDAIVSRIASGKILRFDGKDRRYNNF